MMMSVKEAGQNQTFEQNERLRELYGAISNGANSFLFSEYKLCTVFVVFLAGVIVGLVSWSSGRELFRHLLQHYCSFFCEESSLFFAFVDFARCIAFLLLSHLLGCFLLVF